MLLPETGSVVIIDDRPEEALPIMLALSKNGIACTYFRGYKQNELPTKPIQPVRLVILDLQLFDGVTDPHIIASSLIQILKKIISEQNGPYLLLLWSKKENLYADALKEAVKKPINKIVPAFIISLHKLDCLDQERSTSNEDIIISEVLEELNAGFSEDDLEIIKATLVSKIKPKHDIVYKAKDNVIVIIEEKIKAELMKAGVFHLFIIWENLVKKSGFDTVYAISNTILMDELWEDNMKDIIKRMAKSRTGLNIIDNRRALTESFTILNNSFVDHLESKLRQIQLPEYIKLDTQFLIAEKNEAGLFGIKEIIDPEKKEVRVLISHNGTDSNSILKSKMSNLYSGLKEPEKSVAERLTKIYEQIPYAINTSLHLEIYPSNELMPGNVYSIDVIDDTKKQSYLSTYFDNVTIPLTGFQFIELEVSPICDYAQTKWKKSRLLPGILYPSNLKAKSQFDNLYHVEPIFLIDGKPSKITFDFHLFKACDKETIRERPIAFRLKKELQMDIVVKLSSQINRAGISFMS